MTDAMQPGLRAFVCYNELPAGLAAYPVMDNRSAPHLNVGDIAIIDPHDTTPFEGELFLMHEGMGSERFIINETFTRERIPGWCVGPVAQPSWMSDVPCVPGCPPSRWCDFPYRTEVLEQKLLGRVVGILQPAFAEPKRLACA